MCVKTRAPYKPSTSTNQPTGSTWSSKELVNVGREILCRKSSAGQHSRTEAEQGNRDQLYLRLQRQCFFIENGCRSRRTDVWPAASGSSGETGGSHCREGEQCAAPQGSRASPHRTSLSKGQVCGLQPRGLLADVLLHGITLSQERLNLFHQALPF